MNRSTRKLAGLVCALILCSAVPLYGQSENRSSDQNFSGHGQEFIQSTSRLKNGTTVSSLSRPGQATQTVVSSTVQTDFRQTANQSFAIPVTNQAGVIPQRVARSPQSVLQPPPENFSQPTVQSQPAVQPQGVAQPQGAVWGGNNLGAFNGNAANQIPVLGTTTQPTQQAFANRGLFGCNGCRQVNPVTGYPAFQGAVGSNSILTRYQNLPPGTYVGQGILGQPKAYVDGQPVRNLFRFVSF